MPVFWQADRARPKTLGEILIQCIGNGFGMNTPVYSWCLFFGKSLLARHALLKAIHDDDTGEIAAEDDAAAC